MNGRTPQAVFIADIPKPQPKQKEREQNSGNPTFRRLTRVSERQLSCLDGALLASGILS